MEDLTRTYDNPVSSLSKLTAEPGKKDHVYFYVSITCIILYIIWYEIMS